MTTLNNEVEKLRNTVERKLTPPYRPPSCDMTAEDKKPMLKECPACAGKNVEMLCEATWVICRDSDCLLEGPINDPHGTKWNSIPCRSEVHELLRLVDDFYDVLKSLTNKGEKMSDECLLKGIRQGEFGCFSEDMKQSIRLLAQITETANKLRKELKL